MPPRRPPPKRRPAPPPPAPRPTPGLLTKPWFLGLAGGVLLLAVIAVIAALSRPSAPTVPARSPAITGEQSIPIEAGHHIPTGQAGHWRSDPPSSGEHWSQMGVAPVPWGFTSAAIRPEAWVHNLEHGGVVVLYACPTGCASDLQSIHDLISTAPPEPSFGEVKIIDAPYTVPGHRFAVIAWGWRLFLDTWDTPTARAFYQAHVDTAPELLP